MTFMSETTPEPPSETPLTAEASQKQGHWDKSHRRGGRGFRLAALVVTVAGIVFIVAVIFWSGFMLGAGEGGEGGHHHEGGERDSGQESGGSEKHNGMTPFGVVIEQGAPSVAFAS
jgi:hypothetical protein